jgi:outer membrane protein
MNITKATTALSMVLLGFGAVGVQAASNPADHANEIRVGAYFITYDVKANDLAGPFVPHGVNLDVKNVNTAYFALTRRLTPHFTLQLSGGLPPKTETVGKGPAALGSVPYNGQVVSTAKWFAPTLIINYLFGPEDQKFRPYVGVGVNYTKFYDIKSTAAGDAANGGPTALTLSTSTGPEATIGVAWKVADRCHVYASYSMTQIDSYLTGNTAGTIRRIQDPATGKATRIHFNPRAFVISAGYSF